VISFSKVRLIKVVDVMIATAKCHGHTGVTVIQQDARVSLSDPNVGDDFINRQFGGVLFE